ncbi:nidogen-like domain-containing protein, partial [Salmonella enterica]|uniref:nidogen-like domain-containing protein n=1 Tax=Salmonella enterica TaxID=28901 RepID=UPI003075B7B1
NKTNSFQLLLRNRADTGAGNFDVDFRYERLEWTTGDASYGSNGLGGIPAQAGYDAGDGVNYLTLPGSRTGDVLNLQNSTNVAGGEAGLWS